LADAIRAADAVIIITPEYNYSIPGALKNAIDWVSRLPDQPFKEKPVAIQSATGGPLGGARVQYHLRQAMIFLNAFSFGTPEIFRRPGAHQVRRKDAGAQGRDHQEARGPTARRLREVHRARKGLTEAVRVPMAGPAWLAFGNSMLVPFGRVPSGSSNGLTASITGSRCHRVCLVVDSGCVLRAGQRYHAQQQTERCLTACGAGARRVVPGLPCGVQSQVQSRASRAPREICPG
jgi:hypothetical protein